MTQFYPSSFSSSTSLLDADWNSDTFGQDLGIISADPEELFEGLCSIPRSICDDIRLLESGCPTTFPGSEHSDDFDDTILPEIRNYNCMWSGKYSPENRTTSTSSSTSDNNVSVPMAAITGNNHKMIPTVIKTEPIDDTDNHFKILSRQSMQQQQQLQRQQNHITHQQQQQQNSSQQSMQKIPPGTSLLLNSRKTITANQQHQQQQQQQMTLQQQQTYKKHKNSIQNPVIQTTEFLRDRDLISSYTSSTFGRPDTPHSLEEDDDDITEFKHTDDLTACVMGSNNISLLVDANDPDKMMAINRLREQLEDTNKHIEPSHDGSLADVLSVIVKDSIYDKSNSNNSRTIKDEDEGFFDRQYTSSSSQRNNSSGGWESSDDASSIDGDATSLLSKRSGCSSSMSFSSSNPIGDSNTDYPIKHSDHSYTRSKDGIDDISPNLETPSDSDEEIDVVSIGDKKLPTNPSDKDRRAIQTKVAHKFSTARIVKTPGGIRTIPPRRRISYDLPYTPNSSVSPIKSGSSLTASRYPSPTSTPYSTSSLYSSSSSSSSSKYNHHHTSRKRIAANCNVRTGGSGGGSNSNSVIISDEFMPPSKRHRGKKQKPSPSSSSSSSGVSHKRHYSLDEVDTIEKRNLHNDMERQRRIGLKNLFEALKKQIPTIKDKERAPKVNILREAAKLCENLTREERLLSDQKEMLREQLKKRQEILNQLKSRQGRVC